MKIGQFFKPAPPDAVRVLTLTPMRHVPKAKRPVARRRKRVAVDHVVPASPVKDNLPEEHPKKKIRASYSMSKKQEVVDYAKQTSIYQAGQLYGLSTGTIGPWMKINFSKVKSSVYRSKGVGEN